MDDVRVRGDIILRNVPAIFDTGANHIYGDWDQVCELYKHLGGLFDRELDGFGYFCLPCDSFPILSFTFGGRSFEIPPGALRLGRIAHGSPYCTSAIVAETSDVAYWNIGTTFLQGVYSVFDYSTKQVGLAKLA